MSLRGGTVLLVDSQFANLDTSRPEMISSM